MASALAWIGELLCAGEGGRVGGGLQLAVGVVRVADVDHERGEAQQHDEHHDDEDDHLAAFLAGAESEGSAASLCDTTSGTSLRRRGRTTPR